MSRQRAVENVARSLARNARAEDRVLIVLDSEMDPAVGEILVAAAEQQGLSHEILSSPPAPAPNAEPDPAIAAALLHHDLILLATSVPIAHTAAVRRANEAGARFIVMDGVSSEMLAAGAATADYDRVHELGLVLERRWNEARHVRVTSELGTDFEADVASRKSWRWDGTVFQAEWFSLTGCAFPDGEVGIAPLEGSGTGIVVWDASVHSLGLLREPVRLVVEDGWITSIDGGPQARELAERLVALDDRNSYYCPAEVAIGINEAAQISGTMREDKKALGTVHIACGTNIDLGGTIAAKIHIDGLIGKPTLWMDDELIVERGLLVPEVVG